MLKAMSAFSLAVMIGVGEGMAQIQPAPTPEWYLGVGAIVSEPKGEFAHSVGTNGGVGLNVRYNPRKSSGFGLRADFAFIRYGSNSKPVCLSAMVGCRVHLEVLTANDILISELGAEWVLPTGRFRPYLAGSAGLSYFYTHSSLEGLHEEDDIANTTNFSDVALGWRTGGGFLFGLVGGRMPVALDLALFYHRNGTAEYLTEVDIEDLPGGSINMYPRRSDTNFLSFRLGVSMGISTRP